MIPCPECARFVRTDARHCPFCDAVVRERPSLGPAVVGALLGLGMSACSDETGTTTTDSSSGQTTYESGVTAYGGPDPGFDSSEEGPPPSESSSSGSGSETSAEPTGTGTSAETGTGTDTGTGTGTDGSGSSGAG